MLKCYSFPYEEQEASDNTDLSLRVQTVGLCHPAAGHQDLNASPCDIHLVLYCWEWCACLCLQRQAGGYCGQNLRLASLLAETNVSIIASWGKTAVLCPCTVEQATRSEAGGYNNRGGSWGHDSEANQTGRFLLWKEKLLKQWSPTFYRPQTSLMPDNIVINLLRLPFPAFTLDMHRCKTMTQRKILFFPGGVLLKLKQGIRT